MLFSVTEIGDYKGFAFLVLETCPETNLSYALTKVPVNYLKICRIPFPLLIYKMNSELLLWQVEV